MLRGCTGAVNGDDDEDDGDDEDGGGGGDGGGEMGDEEFMLEGMEGLQAHMNHMLVEAAEQHALAANHGGNVQARQRLHAPFARLRGGLLVKMIAWVSSAGGEIHEKMCWLPIMVHMRRWCAFARSHCLTVCRVCSSEARLCVGTRTMSISRLAVRIC